LSMPNRVTQDRRSLSRMTALMQCTFTYDGVSHEAVVVNLSMGGAFLSSRFLPPKGASVEVTLQSRHLKHTLTLEARVVRGGWGTSERGELGRFGIQFIRLAPELIVVLRALVPDWQASNSSAATGPSRGGRLDP
jgi:hypothetical protein